MGVECTEHLLEERLPLISIIHSNTSQIPIDNFTLPIELFDYFKMRLSLLASLATATTGVIAATIIPLLDKVDVWGFVNLDVDGVLRSWYASLFT